MSENKERGNSESLNPQSTSTNLTSEVKGLVLKEEIVGGKINDVIGEEKTITKVNDFRGKDTSNWKANISTYKAITLGEIYDGIELKLKAYGANIEKLFYVKPGADTERIRLRLGGGKDFNINTKGELEVKTELGSVKFTKPLAYQEINGKRVKVEVEYCIQKSEVRKQKSDSENQRPDTKSKKHETGNQKSAHTNPHPQLEYGFTVASYDKSHDLIIDPLLASTYLGGSFSDKANSITIDSGGNIYIAGYTSSSDFPTTAGAYDTSSTYGAFVSKMNKELPQIFLHHIMRMTFSLITMIAYLVILL
jgi:hypothetical protein